MWFRGANCIVLCAEQATYCALRGVVSLRLGQREDSVAWARKALRALGMCIADTHVELRMVDICIHVVELLRRQGHGAEVAWLQEILIQQGKVGALVTVTVFLLLLLPLAPTGHGVTALCRVSCVVPPVDVAHRCVPRGQGVSEPELSAGRAANGAAIQAQVLVCHSKGAHRTRPRLSLWEVQRWQ